MKLISSEESSVKDIAGVIIKDPTLTSRVLKMANSSFYRREGEISTVNQAVMMLGANAIKSLVLSASILNLSNINRDRKDHFRDPRLFWKHSLETGIGAQLLARTISYPVPEEGIVAGLLHDIGILLIDPELFEKDSVINITDFEKVKTHTQICMSFLEKIRVPKDIRKMIKFHHERVDGTGYPSGLEGEEIPLGSRIIAVAEAFEVMTGKSGYRKSMSVENAIKEIAAQKDKQFDREIVETLEKILRKKK